MIWNLLWHLGISLGIFGYIMLSYVFAKGMLDIYAEKGRPKLGLTLALIIFLFWWLVILGLIAHAIYSYLRYGPARDLV